MILEIVARLVGYLPASTAEHLAKALGDLCWLALPSRRAVVRRNLSIAASSIATSHIVLCDKPSVDIERTARESFRHTAMTLIEFLRGYRHPWSDATTIEGREFIDAALAENRGAYILVAHQGNWEACGATLSKQIRPAHALVKKVGGQAMNAFVLRMRRANGFKPIDRTRKGDGVRAIIRALAAGEMAVFVMDQSRPGEPKIPFFGVSAHSNTGLATLWLRHPAPIVPIWMERISFGRHRLHILPQLALNHVYNRQSGSVDNDNSGQAKKAAIIAITQQFNETLESLISQKPEQYFWLHRRWK